MRLLAALVIIILQMTASCESNETAEVELRRIPNRFKLDEMDLTTIAIDTLELATVDSALNAYFTLIQRVTAGELDWSNSETKDATMQAVSVLHEISMIPGQWSLGPYGITYSNDSLKEDLVLWKDWCASKKMLLGWDCKERRVYNRFFRNNSDVVELVFNYYLEFIRTAIQARPFFPASVGERNRFHQVVSSLEMITGIKAQSRPSNPDSLLNVNYRILSRDYDAWKNWYQKNRLQLKWDIATMSLVPSNNGK
ncbi:hypothetical protein GWO43_23470 [candidate division KSB1 bacterium]|nr:hypothetical protein [candidate division KSB1 bacterium]NIR73169.1 hypothetical protein [candidate division KSB1 bacterium]NIS26939.1 hypothetical protein [candidate division KSB1 bacterium]NIT73777.1 hypothetical protein [candidate division KSB1 bacterium]NIU27683.1 hypothetical protein [candidate division KSB1 bacterium]